MSDMRESPEQRNLRVQQEVSPILAAFINGLPSRDAEALRMTAVGQFKGYVEAVQGQERTDRATSLLIHLTAHLKDSGALSGTAVSELARLVSQVFYIGPAPSAEEGGLRPSWQQAAEKSLAIQAGVDSAHSFRLRDVIIGLQAARRGEVDGLVGVKASLDSTVRFAQHGGNSGHPSRHGAGAPFPSRKDPGGRPFS